MNNAAQIVALIQQQTRSLEDLSAEYHIPISVLRSVSHRLNKPNTAPTTTTPTPAPIKVAEPILAIDPGMTIGIAMLSEDGKYHTCTITNPVELYDLIGTHWSHVVVEQFIAQGRLSSHCIYTIEQIGAIKAICTLRGVPISTQVPQTRRAFLEKSYDYLRMTVHSNIATHEIDALAHLMAYTYGSHKR